MKDITIEWDKENGRHLYEQIYEYIKHEIREGKLLPEERLPSTRVLAEYLQLSRSTVELAYEQLSSEDKFIEGEEKEIENKDDNLKN